MGNDTTSYSDFTYERKIYMNLYNLRRKTEIMKKARMVKSYEDNYLDRELIEGMYGMKSILIVSALVILTSIVKVFA